jgi:hypothetical protein
MSNAIKVLRIKDLISKVGMARSTIYVDWPLEDPDTSPLLT